MMTQSLVTAAINKTVRDNVDAYDQYEAFVSQNFCKLSYRIDRDRQFSIKSARLLTGLFRSHGNERVQFGIIDGDASEAGLGKCQRRDLTAVDLRAGFSQREHSQTALCCCGLVGS